MLSFIRILIPLGLIITLILIVINFIIAIFTTTSFSLANSLHLTTLLIQSLLYFLWSMGLLINTYQLAKQINKGSSAPIRYTTLWFCPRFLFVIIASTYWVLAPIFWCRGKFWKLLSESN